MRTLVITAFAALTLIGCGQTEPGLDPTDGTTQAAEVIEGVDYYFACGNEVLNLDDGRTFYPFVDQDAVDEDAYASATTRGVSSGLHLAMVLAVIEPGPGDDTGTLTIYEDGTAHFISDSGTEAWLTDEEQTYAWAC